ncbi:MAG: SDR family oxidoreductase [Hyphomicrobiaceae bacterium]|nr:SDR family oxidoreductase [Hyphomicrobiaceae bacterium]
MGKAKGKLVLVAGGAGFLGSHLCDALLADGARVICLDNLKTGTIENLRHLKREPRFSFIEADICDDMPVALTSRRRRIEAIFNLACSASPPHYQADPVHTLLTSVVGSRNLLELAGQTDARFLLASTSEVYGDPEVHPQTERYWGNVNPTGPRACYDEGKRAAEALTYDFARTKRASVRVARIFNTYGPRMRADDGRVISNMICQALAGRDVTIYGDGQQTRSFCYVADLVAGLQDLMWLPGPVMGPVNLGNPAEVSVADLARRVIAMTESSSRIASRPLPLDDPRRRKPDISLARALLGWTPRVSLEKGLDATIAWFTQAHGGGLRPRRSRPMGAIGPAEPSSSVLVPSTAARGRA